MPTPFAIPAISTGITLAAVTVPHTFNIEDMTLPEVKLEAIKTSNFSTTTAHTHIPAKLYEGGELKFDVNFNPGSSITAMVGVSDTWTITFPKSPASATTAATWAFSGFVTGYAPKAPLEGLMKASITIKVSGAITVTDQA